MSNRSLSSEIEHPPIADALPVRRDATRPSVLHERFERQAERTPSADALVWSGGRISYRALNEDANRLARRLAALGVGPGTRAALALPRTAPLVTAALAIMKTGAAYVPLDPSYPPARLDVILRRAGDPPVVTDRATSARLAVRAGRRIDLDDEAPRIAACAATNLGTPIDPLDLAYVIYTSGSTGQPKGVAITHASTAALFDWVEAAFSHAELDGMAAVTSICFDLSVFELFGPLTCGGRVLLADHALALGDAPWRDEVRVVNTVPSAMQELLALDLLPPKTCTVCLAGEPFPRALAARLGAVPTVTRVLNLYGPTEDTTYSTWASVAPQAVDPPPIGRPLPGTSAHVLRATGELCQAGEEGELYLGGAGLARGYLFDPAQTASRFVPDHLGSTPGQRLYRTGDRVRRRFDGQLDFLGRVDTQIKLRGFRIELSDVEQALASEPGVDECAVAVVAGPAGDPRLLAYIVGPATPEALARRLSGRLPAHMVPSGFVRLDALPRLPNGKLDRSQLPRPTVWRTEPAQPVSQAYGSA